MRILAVLTLLVVLAGRAHGVPVRPRTDPSRPGCITAGQHREGAINVHLICHSHDDVGWLKTVDQYYYGANNSIQHAGVQYIIDTVVEQCQLNPDRKFTYVEQAFFHRWWTEQPASTKERILGTDLPNNQMTVLQTVRGLVKSGQLQFINGGWSMHDEACTHYVSMIENTAFGHRFLLEEFDYVPTVGWQIDPFGHSGAQASLLSSEVGFDALYFARIDWQEAKVRTREKSMEMMWQGSPSLGADAMVFTGAFLDGGYGPPPGFCFDQNQCNGGFPVMDDECMEDENVALYVDKFVAAARSYANNTRSKRAGSPTQNIMFLMGSDFQYENADGWYKNLDKIIHHVNADGRVNVFYSTPVEYTAAKFKENITWPVKTDDFMPLANDEHSYWTGFYTSRPALKRYERQLAGYLQAARQVQLLADMPVNDVVKAALSSKKNRPWFHFWAGLDRHDMDPLAAAVALTQHHDAVSGTEMQHVAYDYAARLAAGAAVADAACVKALLALARAPPDTPMQLCRLVNESVCDASIGRSSAGLPFNVVIYNPLSKARDGLPVRIPVAVAVEGGSVFRVTNLESGVAVASFLLPSTAIASAQQELQNQAKSAMFELVFQVSLAPFALQSFQVEQGPASRSTLASNPPGSAGTAPWESHGAQTSFYSHSRVPSMPRGGTRAKPAAHERSRGRRVGHGARARTVRASRAGAGEDAPDMLSIENEFIKVGFDSVSGRMLWMLNKEDGVSVDMDHNLHWYESAQAGDAKNTCGEGEQKSGAYIFRPNHTSPDGQSAKCVSADCGASLRVLKAPVVQQVEQTFSAWATQTVRLYQGAKSVEIEWTVGPIPVEDGVGKEVVSRFSTNVSSAGEFKTDSNGRDTLVRKRCITKVGAMDSSCRASVPEYNVTEPVAGNFYPINTVISIQDEKAALGVAVDRAQAGASLVDGQIELMLHRRLLCDDARGVAEPLNETQSISPYDWVDAKGKAHHEPYRIGKGLVVRGKHQVFLTAPASAARAYRALQDEIYYEPVVAVADAFAPTPAPAPGPSSEAPVWRAGCAGGNVDLPENVMILTVEKQPPAAAAASSRRGRKAKARSAGPLVLLRVAHRFGVGEDAYVE